jgi:hypothetical protein
MLDVEQASQARPKGGRELGPSVLSDGGWYSEAGHPPGEEGPGAVGGGDGGERDGLWPPRCPVDDSEQVGMAARRRQRPNQVHVEVGETAVRYRNLCRLQVHVSVNFATLALQAGPWPSG